jgi:hypothetical protein
VIVLIVALCYSQMNCVGKIVKLNVGGVLYATTLSTLENRGENMLTRMLSTKVALLTDENGAVFIDRNGHLFEFVLEFLRTGNTSMVKERFRRPFEEELRFYSITGNAGELSDTSLRHTIRGAVDEANTRCMEQYTKQAEFVVRHILVDLQIRATEGSLRPDASCSYVFVAEILVEREDVSKKFLRALLSDDKNGEVFCVEGIDTNSLERLCSAIVYHFLQEYRLTILYSLERRVFRFKWVPK